MFDSWDALHIFIIAHSMTTFLFEKKYIDNTPFFYIFCKLNNGYELMIVPGRGFFHIEILKDTYILVSSMKTEISCKYPIEKLIEDAQNEAIEFYFKTIKKI